jgi:hypothetical protein
MVLIYIRKDRKLFLDDAITCWLNFSGWCHSLLDKDDVSYIRSKGIKGLNLYFFLIFFYPLFFIRKFGFSGVPFPFNLLKKKNKNRVNVQKKTNTKVIKIKRSKNYIKKLKKERKLLVSDPNNNYVPDDVKILDEKLVLVSAKVAKDVASLKKSVASKGLKKKKRMSNNSHVLRMKKRDEKMLFVSGKDMKSSGIRLLFHGLHRAFLSGDDSLLSEFSFCEDFIARSKGRLINIKEQDIKDWLTQHSSNKDFIAFVFQYLGKRGFVSKKFDLGAMLDILYPNLLPY